jgi:hypothetical protein
MQWLVNGGVIPARKLMLRIMFPKVDSPIGQFQYHSEP